MQYPPVSPHPQNEYRKTSIPMKSVGLEYWLMEATGNRLAVVEAADDMDWPRFSRWLCDTSCGVGADGLVRVTSGSEPEFAFWNPDGTPDFSGNGLCCAGLFLSIRTPGTHGSLAIRARNDWCSVQIDPGHNQAGARVSAELPAPLFDPPSIPTNLTDGSGRALGCQIQVAGRELTVFVVSTGTPHCVLICDRRPDDHEFMNISAALETHPAFPERTSVLWVEPVSKERMDLRIWERGVGETAGCGTGACAAAIVGGILGLTGRAVNVVSSGGTSRVRYGIGLRPRLSVEAALLSIGTITPARSANSTEFALGARYPVDIADLSPSNDSKTLCR
jgi:diaminopimelate epimerase